MNEIAIVVMTSDKYFSLVEYFLFYYYKNPLFDDACIYIVSEEKYGNDTNNVKYLRFSDMEWSHRLGLALTKIEQEYIFLMLDDMYLLNEIDHLTLRSLYTLLKMGNFLSVRSLSTGNEAYLNIYGQKLDGYDTYILNKNYYYQNHFLVGAHGLYNRKKLLKLLRRNENPWEFEYNASFRFQYFSRLKIGVIVAGKMNYGFPETGIIARGKIYPEYKEILIGEFPSFHFENQVSDVTTSNTHILIRYSRILPRHLKKIINIFFNKITL
jgi:hypothetical protein